MLIPKTLSRTKVALLVIVLVLVLGAIAYVIYLGVKPRGIARPDRNPSEELFGPGFVLPTAPESFDPAFFDDPLVRSLQNNSGLPLKVGSVGRSNPFEPLNPVPASGRR